MQLERTKSLDRFESYDDNNERYNVAIFVDRIRFVEIYNKASSWKLAHTIIRKSVSFFNPCNRFDQNRMSGSEDLMQIVTFTNVTFSATKCYGRDLLCVLAAAHDVLAAYKMKWRKLKQRK